LSNDELSALLRTAQPSFKALISKGVMATDPHPAGVQVFLYYWVSWFGNSPFAFRLPFVLFSIATLWMVYRLGELWFGTYPALLVMALMATLEFPILFGQIARPYSPGLLFSVCLAYYWSKFTMAQATRRSAMLYILFATLCCYTHYFSGLFAAIVGATGLFVVKRQQWRSYIIANVLIVILFLPHLGITLHQLEVGGLSGWLPKPTPAFLPEHFSFLFNDSFILMVITTLIILIGAVLYRKSIQANPFRWISLIWFLAPMGIAYTYSIYYETVLMDRVLLFSFPFVLLFLSSFVLPQQTTKWMVMVVLVLLTTGATSTVFEKNFYKTAHFEDFNLITNTVQRWNEQYGEANISRTINVNNPFYLDYYFQRADYNTTFVVNKTIDAEGIANVMRLLDTAQTPYFMAGWACIYNPYELPELIKQKYPVEVERVSSFNTELVLYGKGDVKKRSALYLDTFQLCETTNNWSVVEEMSDSTLLYDGCPSYPMNAALEYGPTLRLKPNWLVESTANVVSVSVDFHASDTLDVLLVVSIDRGEENLGWHSVELNAFMEKGKQWNRAMLSVLLPSGMQPDDQLSAYLWNKGKHHFSVGRMVFMSFEDSEYHYFD
jgi:hypothetical protein